MMNATMICLVTQDGFSDLHCSKTSQTYEVPQLNLIPETK